MSNNTTLSPGDAEDSRHARMQKLAHHVRPLKGTPEHAAMEKLYKDAWKTPEFRASVKQMHQVPQATISAQQDSGAGYASDKALREFQMEYQARLSSLGSSSFPTSFNVLEAFFQTRKEVAGFFLLPEKDYLINFTDFLDFVTSKDGPQIDISAAKSLPQGVIVNVNCLDAPGELLLETDSGHSFTVLGASYVRRGDELSMLMVVGEKLPETEWEALLRTCAEESVPTPNKPRVIPNPGLKAAPVYIDTQEELLRDLVLCRFNLKEGRLEARCLLRDTGNRYQVLTDIVETLRHSGPEKSREMAERMGHELDQASAVWECAKMLLLLPSYLRARVSSSREETRQTPLGLQLRNSLKRRREADKAFPESKILFRVISAIRVEHPPSTSQVTGRSYSLPQFQVPVTGFWRIFSDSDRLGHDEEGQPITGKTWVKSHLRHRDKSEGPKVVYIKASLAHARRQLERYKQQHTGASPSAVAAETQSAAHVPSAEAEPVAAFVYAMRCPAHGRDIYKVGYTDRDPEVRARELSAATSAPAAFLVVQAWAVTDGLAAEQAAHLALAHTRVAGNREFFQAGYAALRTLVEGAIKPWEL